MRALDLEAVQAFVLVADLKSFTRAAEAMDTTQSAVSVKIKRLEEDLGRRIIERTPRLVRLSSEGATFLGPARELLLAHGAALDAFRVNPRRLIVGLSHHIVGPELPLLIRRMSDAEPGLVLELRVASSRETLDEYDAGRLDAAIVLARDQRRVDGEIIMAEPFAWMAARDYQQKPGEPLRLATQSQPCIVRTMAVEALEAAGITWTEVFIGGGIATIGAAVSAGLAVAALSRRVAPADVIDIGPRLGLPPLGTRDVLLCSAVSDAATRVSLRSLVAVLKSTVDRRAA
jgi:DNA-binding transcriptional LysR family regulator